MKKNIVLLAICLLQYISYAQIETNYYLKNSMGMRIKSLSRGISTKTFTIPTFDVDKLRQEDEALSDSDVPYRFGKAFDVSLSLKDGTWENTDRGRIWSLTFKSEGAHSLNFVFNNFHLPDSAYLYITSENDISIYGPVTGKDIGDGRFFLTDLLAGSQATIYLYEPTEQKGKSTLMIKRVVHGYRDVSNMLYGNVGASSSCNEDVACFPRWEKESKAIGLVLLADGTSMCSGSLLMTTDSLFKPYFLTAFHCIDIEPFSTGELTQNEISLAEQWLFKFCFKKKDCNGNILATSYSYNQATFRAAYNKTDFALMEINHDLSTNNNLFWLGWDKSGNIPTRGVGIHHPSGDVMKISIENDRFKTQPWNLYDAYHHWCVDFDYGIVEGGSSGSPILNEQNRVVGQLHGGPTYKNNRCKQTVALYGKLSQSWNGGGTNSTRLSNWLDPLNTNQLTIDGSEPYSPIISGPYYAYNRAKYTIEKLISGANVEWYTSNPDIATISSNGILTVHSLTPYTIQIGLTISTKEFQRNRTLPVNIGIPNMTITPITPRIEINGEEGRVYGLSPNYENITHYQGLNYLTYIWYCDGKEIKRYQNTHISDIQEFIPFNKGKEIFVRVMMPDGGYGKNFTYTVDDESQMWSFHLLSNPVKSSVSLVLKDQMKGTLQGKNIKKNSQYEIQLWSNSSWLRTYKVSSNHFEFSVADLPKGMYIIRVIKNGQMRVQKLLKE